MIYDHVAEALRDLVDAWDIAQGVDDAAKATRIMRSAIKRGRAALVRFDTLQADLFEAAANRERPGRARRSHLRTS